MTLHDYPFPHGPADLLSMTEKWDCLEACDPDCEVGSVHCVNVHLPRHRRSHEPDSFASRPVNRTDEDPPRSSLLAGTWTARAFTATLLVLAFVAYPWLLVPTVVALTFAEVAL